LPSPVPISASITDMPWKIGPALCIMLTSGPSAFCTIWIRPVVSESTGACSAAKAEWNCGPMPTRASRTRVMACSNMGTVTWAASVNVALI
jgi:hypothetical protein